VLVASSQIPLSEASMPPDPASQPLDPATVKALAYGAGAS